jgi:hypothetical protein
MDSDKTASSGPAGQIVPAAYAKNQAPWYKQTELRKLYFLMPFLFLGSTTLGYDGSVLNGLQAMDTWQSCNYSSLIKFKVF